ncbi:MAG: hypothetical protein ACOCQ3_00810 [Natronomonas sp.]
MGDDAYSGVIGAVPYAFRQSRSTLFRSYVILGGGLAAMLVVLFTFAVIGVVATTAGATGGTMTFVRSLFVLVGVLCIAPLLGPILFVARRHRRGRDTTSYDAGLALSGYGFAITLYLGAIASMPRSFELDDEIVVRPEPSGITAPIVDALYGFPEFLAWLIPLGGAIAIYVVHRQLR